MSFIENLTNVKPTKVIPESCISFSEQSLYVAENAMNNYNEFVRNVGINELNNYEQNQIELVYTNEAADIMINNIEDLHTKNFSSVKEQYNKIYNNFKTTLEETKSLLEEINIDNISNNKNICKVHTFFNPNNINFAENTTNFSNEIKQVFSNLEEASKEEIDEATNLLEASICKAISGIESNDSREMKNVVKEALIGDYVVVDKKFLESFKEQIESIVLSNTILENIEKFYDAEKNAYDNIISDINSVKENSNILESMLAWNKIVVLAESVMNDCYSTVFDVYNRMLNEYRNIVVKANILAEKADEGPVAEDKDGDKLRAGKEKYDSNKKEGVKQEPVGKALESTEEVDEGTALATTGLNHVNGGPTNGVKAAAAVAAVGGAVAAKKIHDKLKEKKAKKEEAKKSEKNDSAKNESYEETYNFVKSSFEF